MLCTDSPAPLNHVCMTFSEASLTNVQHNWPVAEQAAVAVHLLQLWQTDNEFYVTAKPNFTPPGLGK